MRMFVAVQPPEAIREQIAEFLEPRESMPWIHPDQWHLTLAFYADVPGYAEDELIERLASAAARRSVFELNLAGGGVFPNPIRASVLWLDVDDPADALPPLAVNSRAAGNAVGATPDGKAFVPHLTLARLRRPIEATKWLQILDTFRSDPWLVTELELVASYLGESSSRRPRYETVATLPLSR